MYMHSDRMAHQKQAQMRIEHLTSEIALYQSRINGMGLDGDCAYERALIKVYNDLLVRRNLELEKMRTTVSM